MNVIIPCQNTVELIQAPRLGAWIPCNHSLPKPGRVNQFVRFEYLQMGNHPGKTIKLPMPEPVLGGAKNDAKTKNIVL